MTLTTALVSVIVCSVVMGGGRSVHDFFGHLCYAKKEKKYPVARLLSDYPHLPIRLLSVCLSVRLSPKSLLLPKFSSSSSIHPLAACMIHLTAYQKVWSVSPHAISLKRKNPRRFIVIGILVVTWVWSSYLSSLVFTLFGGFLD